MSAPLNDAFANATPLATSGSKHTAAGTLVGATVEPTEFDSVAALYGDQAAQYGEQFRTLLSHTVWHTWTVPDDVDDLFLKLTSGRQTPNMAGYVWTAPSDGSTPTVGNVELAGFFSVGFVTQLGAWAVPGRHLFLQIAETNADDGNLTTYALEISSDLLPLQFQPNFPSKITKPAASVSIVEAIGYGPDREVATSRVVLGANDSLSLQARPIPRNSDGSPATSTERWLRVMFEPPFTKITDLRFWVEGYAPSSDWTIQWGLAADFARPTRDESSVVYAGVPTSDNGFGMLGEVNELTPGSACMVSDWLVLQATCTSPVGGTVIQDPLPHLKFAWSEV